MRPRKVQYGNSSKHIERNLQRTQARTTKTRARTTVGRAMANREQSRRERGQEKKTNGYEKFVWELSRTVANVKGEFILPLALLFLISEPYQVGVRRLHFDRTRHIRTHQPPEPLSRRPKAHCRICFTRCSPSRRWPSRVQRLQTQSSSRAWRTREG